jgi:hypothetical protein
LGFFFVAGAFVAGAAGVRRIVPFKRNRFGLNRLAL